MAISKKTYIIGGAILAAIIILYLVFRKKSPDAELLAAVPESGGFVSDPDAKLLIDYFRDNAEPAALLWLLKNADARYKAGALPEDYKVGGKVTKAGAFMSVYASDYHGNPAIGQYKNGKDAFNSGIYAIFDSIRLKYIA